MTYNISCLHIYFWLRMRVFAAANAHTLKADSEPVRSPGHEKKKRIFGRRKM